MQTNPPKENIFPSVSSFSPPIFPPKADLAVRLHHSVLKGFLGIAKLTVSIGLILLYSFYILDGYATYHVNELSDRDILLERGVFYNMDENRTEISSSDLLPGDHITFTHFGNITETEYSSTSCSSGSSSGYYGDSDSESYYGGEDKMECWTDYYTHYSLNASWVMFETRSVSEIYQCHRSTCKIIGELVNVDNFLIQVRSVEVIS
jgi:hypothetical protein